MEVGSCDNGLCDGVAKNSPKQILDKKEKVLRTKTIPLVKVSWDHHGMEGPTWDHVGYHLVLGCLETLYKGLQLVCTISLQQLGLERESRERKCRFEAKIAYLEETQKGSRPYHLLYCLCGTVGPWVKVPKALEEDTPMWVYGVGPAPGF
ncbi:hypothetical protein AAG906_038363 [Vitis piasezkii]